MADRPAVRRHIEQRALFELARYGERIDTVRIRVCERPRPVEPRFHCGIALTVVHPDRTSDLVLARGQDDDVFRLVQSVLERTGRLAGGEIARADAASEARSRWSTAASTDPRGMHEPVSVAHQAVPRG